MSTTAVPCFPTPPSIGPPQSHGALSAHAHNPQTGAASATPTAASLGFAASAATLGAADYFSGVYPTQTSAYGHSAMTSDFFSVGSELARFCEFD